MEIHGRGSIESHQVGLKIVFSEPKTWPASSELQAQGSDDVREIQLIQTGLSISTKVYAGMGGTPGAPTINLVIIRPSRSRSQTHNAWVLPKKPTAIYLTKLKNENLEFKNFSKIVKKTVVNEAKANLRS